MQSPTSTSLEASSFEKTPKSKINPSSFGVELKLFLNFAIAPLTIPFFVITWTF